jgi:predicted nucleic acid-binding Zn ribbon protein
MQNVPKECHKVIPSGPLAQNEKCHEVMPSAQKREDLK